MMQIFAMQLLYVPERDAPSCLLALWLNVRLFTIWGFSRSRSGAGIVVWAPRPREFSAAVAARAV